MQKAVQHGQEAPAEGALCIRFTAVQPGGDFLPQAGDAQGQQLIEVQLGAAHPAEPEAHVGFAGEAVVGDFPENVLRGFPDHLLPAGFGAPFFQKGAELFGLVRQLLAELPEDLLPDEIAHAGLLHAEAHGHWGALAAEMLRPLRGKEAFGELQLQAGGFPQLFFAVREGKVGIQKFFNIVQVVFRSHHKSSSVSALTLGFHSIIMESEQNSTTAMTKIILC